MKQFIKKVLWIVIILTTFTVTFIAVGLFGNAGFLKKENKNIQLASVDESSSAFTEEPSQAITTEEDVTTSIDENIETEEESIVSEEKEEIQFDKDDWKLILVNKEHPIPEDYTFELATISGSMECDARILEPLNEMFTAAAEEGVNLVVCSPYRESSRQEYLFDRKMRGYLNSGYSYIDAFKESSAVVTVPGSSEHQIGLSLDIISDNYYKLDEKFGGTDAGIWLMKNAHKYGFIMRYPKGKDYITGIIYEPWHYRYVGVEAATIIYEKNITLEEFVGNL